MNTSRSTNNSKIIFLDLTATLLTLLHSTFHRTYIWVGAMSSNNRVHTTLEVLQIITCQATTVEHLQITTTTCILETLTTTSMNFTLATILHLWTLALQQLIPGLKEKQEEKKRGKKRWAMLGKKLIPILVKPTTDTTQIYTCQRTRGMCLLPLYCYFLSVLLLHVPFFHFMFIPFNFIICLSHSIFLGVNDDKKRACVGSSTSAIPATWTRPSSVLHAYPVWPITFQRGSTKKVC